ncbi:DNA-binding GntR family transcriptional regulator [Cryobacterium sp. MP_M5]|uniref:GntR family transcriptional regulator n=1 Tax=unclassified Cryobacterium TaxID=2649013 RepID=UPI0018CBE9EA|nr:MULTISPECIES: GntR family transcriptional regulator [unclassified Cryobacterium]MBG6057584.1 DNA-binding GntR family transcriptional regulator [Cryobacterium sp. MP_M3]MEC5175901.1 DNA-binding GntR family transcriptional regulator [Cryobacterium sp. MP_M5]
MPVPARDASHRPASLRDYAYEALRTAIVDGTLAPGEKLRDAELESWLGVSRTPIREAIARLETAGLVRTERARQTVVAPLDERLALGAQAIAAALHELAAREAVAQLTMGDIAAMEAANERFRRALAANDIAAAIAADDDFHAVTVRASANELLPALLEQVTPTLRRLERARFSSLAGRASVTDHERIIRLCAAGQADAAGVAVRENWLTLGRILATAAEPDDD